MLPDLGVVDFGQYIAGPFAAVLLADQHLHISLVETIEHVGDMTMPGDHAPVVLASIGMADRLDALLRAGAITMTHVPASPSPA
jgi:hypothetical protein